MAKSHVWANWSEIDYDIYPYRKSWRAVAGTFEFPVDRFKVSNLLEIPCVNIVKKPIYNLSNISQNFEERYYATLDAVAANVYNKAGDTKKIHLLYSGGVDSVAMFAALQRNSKYSEFVERNRFVVSLTSSSIDEYPFLFYTVILPTLPIVPLDYVALMSDPNILLVTGDMGDYMIGSSDVVSITNHDKSYDIMSSWNTIFDYVENYDGHEKYIDLAIQAKRKQPFEIESANQFVWWLSQCFCYQDELVRPYIWSTETDLSTMVGDDKVFRFFYDDLFTSFSYEYMSTNPQYKTFDDTRTWPKRYIVNHFGDSSYMDKPKIYSQRLTFRTVNATQIYYENGKLYSKNTGIKIE